MLMLPISIKCWTCKRWGFQTQEANRCVFMKRSKMIELTEISSRMHWLPFMKRCGVNVLLWSCALRTIPDLSFLTEMSNDSYQWVFGLVVCPPFEFLFLSYPPLLVNQIHGMVKYAIQSYSAVLYIKDCYARHRNIVQSAGYIALARW